MFVKRQFSLKFVLLEIFWIATACGLFRLAAASFPGWLGVGAILGGAAAVGAAIGGLSDQTISGAVMALVLTIVIGSLLLPAAMSA
jgi:hypothetical protein